MILILVSKFKQEVLSYDSFDDIDLIRDIYIDSCMKVSECYSDFVTFSNDERHKIKRPAKLNRLIIPHGDIIKQEE